MILRSVELQYSPIKDILCKYEGKFYDEIKNLANSAVR